MDRKTFDELGSRDALRRTVADRLGPLGEFLVARIRSNSPDRSGELDASYKFEIDETLGMLRVGSELVRSKYVELGTIRMSPQAPIRRALAESTNDILRVLGDVGA